MNTDLRRKMKSFLVLAVFAGIALCGANAAEVKDYTGCQVTRAWSQKSVDLEILTALENSGRYDFWSAPKQIGALTDIFTCHEETTSLHNALSDAGIQFTILHEDIQRLIDAEAKERATRAHTQNFMGWDDYRRTEIIHDWLTNLTILYPDLISMENIGLSTEGRALPVVKISTGGDNKPAFWMDGTIHAREWISPATVTYIINELVTKSHLYWDILESVDFYILPVMNPDGYEYSFDSDRLWRKTRKDHDSPIGCIGVDANRNFGFGFGGPGSSNDKCSQTYRGPEAYSEPECDAVKNYIQSKPEVNWQAFVTVHSYSQLWMTPYGYTLDFPENYEELKALADEAVEALTAVHGTPYIAGAASDILYQSSGSSRDWAHGEGGFRWVYTLELRDEGRYGFLLPPEQILPTCEETWAGLQVVARHLLTEGKLV